LVFYIWNKRNCALVNKGGAMAFFISGKARRKKIKEARAKKRAQKKRQKAAEKGELSKIRTEISS